MRAHGRLKDLPSTIESRFLVFERRRQRKMLAVVSNRDSAQKLSNPDGKLTL